MALTDTSIPSLLAAAHRDRPRLLVVDDQPINIQVLYQLFAADHQVFMATSGEQALKVCEEVQPDLVLLDVVMPGMDGFEVCRRLRAQERTADVPVIFVTAHHDPSEEEKGFDAGAVDFIAKPIHPRLVRARVKNHLTLKLQSDLLRQMALRDGLTGLFNRRYFDERLAGEWQRACRQQTALSLLLIDIDHFKRYNDHYGHQAGDECLRRVAQALRASVARGADIVARYGGEEFAAILPDTDDHGARAIAARMMALVAEADLEHRQSDVSSRVTISIGIGVKLAGTGGGQMQELLALADQQLYEAKRAGRARTHLALLGSSLQTAP